MASNKKVTKTSNSKRPLNPNAINDAVSSSPERLTVEKYRYIIDNLIKFNRARLIQDGKLITYSNKNLKGFNKSKCKRLCEEAQTINNINDLAQIIDTIVNLKDFEITTTDIPSEYFEYIKNNRIAQANSLFDMEDLNSDEDFYYYYEESPNKKKALEYPRVAKMFLIWRECFQESMRDDLYDIADDYYIKNGRDENPDSYILLDTYILLVSINILYILLFDPIKFQISEKCKVLYEYAKYILNDTLRYDPYSVFGIYFGILAGIKDYKLEVKSKKFFIGIRNKDFVKEHILKMINVKNTAKNLKLRVVTDAIIPYLN